MWFAHTRDGLPEEEWEKLRDHLAAVAEAARLRGSRFGAGDIAGLAGQVHDLGKYSLPFQERLRGHRQRVDHSTAGAVWARERLAGRWGSILAHVVAGHHAGLQDDLLAPDGRLVAGHGLLASAEMAAQTDGVTLPGSVAGPDLNGRNAGFILTFLTRMVFSCLLDADRTETARFTDGEEEAIHPSLPALEAELARWMAAQPHKPTPLNAVRASVLRAALAKADRPPGVFTLTVPTGGGKTLASLRFALAHARANRLDRVVVVVPFTSIIEQTAGVYRHALGAHGDAVLEHHSAFEREDEAAWSRDRVGPERLRLAMQRWDSPVVVTTAVQFFESLFASRASRCRKLHSLARSVIVVDEAQTMPLPLLRPCVAALRELARNYGSTVVLCTATQPALNGDGPHPFVGGFRNVTELADVPDLFPALRRVTVRSLGVQDDSALAGRITAAPQVLCIVNQRAHARALFRACAGLAGVRHLSTCMHAVHRRRVLAEIRDDLAHGRACRVVSTSLVEAGVDVDFPLVLRATAGLDQVAQAGGRCNREGKRPPAESEVLVFEAPEFGVIQGLRTNAETGREVLATHADDPFGEAAMRAYFEMLYERKGKAELDRSNVLEMHENHKADLNFPFAAIADAVRFIDDANVPVIVPKEEAQPGDVERWVRDLPHVKGTGALARKLGPYTVGVPRRARSAMLAAGVAEAVAPDKLGDQFVVLGNLDLYSREFGLDWINPTYREAEGLMVG